MILKLPDGSAIEAQYVKAITWDSYSDKGVVRIYGYKATGGFGLGGSSGLEQIHAVKLDSAEAAKAACATLVEAWTGPKILAEA